MIQRYSRLHVWVPAGAVAFILAVLGLQSCGLFTPSREELFDYCIHDPEMQKRAVELNVDVGTLCAGLIAAEESAQKHVCDGGSCQLP